MEPALECDVTEIEIAPDGRLLIFGASREVMVILAEFGIAAAQRRASAGPLGAGTKPLEIRANSREVS